MCVDPAAGAETGVTGAGVCVYAGSNAGAAGAAGTGVNVFCWFCGAGAGPRSVTVGFRATWSESAAFALAPLFLLEQPPAAMSNAATETTGKYLANVARVLRF